MRKGDHTIKHLLSLMLFINTVISFVIFHKFTPEEFPQEGSQYKFVLAVKATPELYKVTLLKICESPKLGADVIK